MRTLPIGVYQYTDYLFQKSDKHLNNKGRYFAKISVNKKKIHLGRFHTIEEAHKAFKQASSQYTGRLKNRKPLLPQID